MAQTRYLFSLALLLWPLITISAPSYLSLVPSAYGASSTPMISVQGEYYSSSDIVDPSLVPGASVNVTVQAANLPSIVDRSDGGLQGFDITLTYDSNILRPELTAFNGPFCSNIDECIFANLTDRDFLTFKNQTDVSGGTLRIGMVVYSPMNRAVSAGVLFKVEFLVVGLGVTPVQVDTASSFLIGFSQACGLSISYPDYTVQNAYLDNRRPWIVTASPTSTSLPPGASARVNVTVIRVNSDGNVTLLIPSGGLPFAYSFSPRTGILNEAKGLLNFTSTLTLNASSAASLQTYVIPIVAHDTFSPGGFREYRLNYTVTVDPVFAKMSMYQSASNPYSRVSLSVVSGVGYGSSDPVLPLLANFTLASSDTNVTFAAIVCGGTLPYTYTWDFGDGTTGTGRSIVHVYSRSGNFVVTLKVEDVGGQSFSATQTISVNSESNINLYVVFLALGLLATLIVGFVFSRLRRRR